jgi:hypothetical protein
VPSECDKFVHCVLVGAGVAQSVCLTMNWMIGRSGFDLRQTQRIFHLASVLRPALGVVGILPLGVKRGRGMTDHSLPSSAQAPQWHVLGQL